MNTNFKRFLLIAVTCAGLLTGGEVGTRAKDWRIGYAFFSNAHRNLLAQPIKQIVPYRVLGWNLYHFNNETLMITDVDGNEYPFLKNTDAFRVVMFGEEAAYAPPLRAILAARFPNHRLEIINVSHEAYALTHSLTLLTFDVLSWQPDLLIVSHNFNDREAAYFPNPLPDYSNKYGTAYFMPNYPNPFTAPNYLFQWSHFYWALKEKIAELRTASVRPLRASMLELPDASTKFFTRNLDTFITIAQSRHIPLLLASQPINQNENVWDTYLKKRPYNHEVPYPLHEEFLAHHRLFNNLISERARAHNVPFVDLAEIEELKEVAEHLADTITRFDLINQ